MDFLASLGIARSLSRCVVDVVAADEITVSDRSVGAGTGVMLRIEVATWLDMVTGSIEER